MPLVTIQNVNRNPLNALPDFENFSYEIAIEPDNSQVSAWNKLRECERRLEMYKWVEKHNDPANPQHRVLLYDTLIAYLLTFEATLQFLKNHLELKYKNSSSKFKFSQWLDKQRQYDLTVRGLRTMRHLEAHVDIMPKPRETTVTFSNSLSGGTSDSKISYSWRLTKLQQTNLNNLQSPPLKCTSLKDWNDLVSRRDVASIFTDGLGKLKKILEAAETGV